MSKPVKFKKWDRIETDYKGKTVYGVVAKGGSKKIEMVLDGGKKALAGAPVFFRHSDKPLPKDPPNLMDKWGIRKYKEIEGHGDSPTFSAEITLNGQPVIHASNNGWGGPNFYERLNLKDKGVVEAFKKDAEEWYKLFSGDEPFEPDNLWITWHQFGKPYGETAKEHIADFDRRYRNLNSPSPS